MSGDGGIILSELRNILFVEGAAQFNLDEPTLLSRCLNAISCVILGNGTVGSLVQLLKDWKTGLSDPVQIQPITNCIMSSLWVVGTQSKTYTTYNSSNLASLVKDLINLGFVDATLLKSTLELPTLADCGLIRDAEQPVQRIIKINTGLVYKQQKYNLLREETEGYSKLLMTLMNVPVYPGDCQMVIDSIRSIIGQFDLDPNRMFDIILDCFEQQPGNASFLRILLALKPVNLVHTLGFKLSQYHPPEVPMVQPSSTTATNSTGTISLPTKPSPKQPSAVVNPPKVEEVPKHEENNTKLTTPDSLMTVAATLIVSGMVSLDELLPYLEPNLESTAKLIVGKEKQILQVYNDIKFEAKSLEKFHFFQKDLSMRKGTTWQTSKSGIVASTVSTGTLSTPGSSSNLLNLTQNIAVGASGKAPPPPPPTLTLPTSAKESKATATLKDKQKDKVVIEEEDLHLQEFTYFPCSLGQETGVSDNANNQILTLIVALLKVHGWRQAKEVMLWLQPYGVQQDSLLICCPSIRTELSNLVSWSLDHIYRQSNNICGKLSCPKLVSIDMDNVNIEGMTFHRFQQISSFDIDFFPKVWELVQVLGLHIAENSLLFTKLCRLLKEWVGNKQNQLKTTTEEERREVFLNNALQLQLLLLQNLAVSGVDATYLASQLWQSISLLNFQDRFALYELWKTSSENPILVTTKQLIGTKLAQSYASTTIRREMKRLTKETSKQIGQKLAKFMHGNPLIFMNYMLAQVENFDNLIPYVIEALRFSTDLSRDAFAFCILDHLNKKKEEKKIKDADTHYYPWFIAISKFTASFYCKFAGTEIKGLLHYLLDSFSNGQAADLLILKDLLGIMGGSVTLLELSHGQLDGLAGGKNLRAEAMGLATSITMSGGKSSALSTKRSAIILRDELIASQVALPMLLFIAQMRNNVIFASESHLKLISFFFDNVQDLMMQFADFLIGEAKSIDIIAQLMPPFEVLLKDVGLSLPVAFQLARPLMRHALQQQGIAGATTSNWLPFDESLQRVVGEHTPSQSLWQVLNIRLYMLFWSLSLYDIFAPVDKYQYEIKRIKDKYAELDRKSTTTINTANLKENEIAKLRKQREADMKQMMITVAALSDELLIQKKHVDQVKELLSTSKDSLIVSRSNHSVSGIILQHLVLPRVMMSPADAVFCVRFCKVLHELEVPNFCLLEFYNGFIELMLPLLFASTETEAKVIGHALHEILAVVNRWRKSQSIYQLDTKSKCVIFHGDTTDSNGNNKSSSSLSHKKFIDVVKVWHTKILDVVYNAISAKEFIYIRTALIFLTKVSPQFPFLKSEGNKLLQRLQKLEKDEKERGDLQLLAKSVITILKQNCSGWFDDEPPSAKKPPLSGSNNSKGNSSDKNIGESSSSKGKGGKSDINAVENKISTSGNTNKTEHSAKTDKATPTKPPTANSSNLSNNTINNGSKVKNQSSNQQSSGSTDANSTNTRNGNKDSSGGASKTNAPNENNAVKGSIVSTNNSNPNSKTNNSNGLNSISTNGGGNSTTNNVNRERSSSKQRSNPTPAASSTGTGSNEPASNTNNNKRKAAEPQPDGLPPTKLARQQSGGATPKDELSNKDDKKGATTATASTNNVNNNLNANPSRKQDKVEKVDDTGQKKVPEVPKKDEPTPPPPPPRQTNGPAKQSAGSAGGNVQPGSRNSSQSNKAASVPPPPPPPPGPPPAPQLSVHGHVNYNGGRSNYAPPPPPPHHMGGNYGGRYNDGRADYDPYDNRGDYDPYDPYRSRQDYDYGRRPPPNNSNNGGNFRQQDDQSYYKKPRN